jgi:hypothetical protein
MAGDWPNIAEAGLLVHVVSAERLVLVDDGSGGQREELLEIGELVCRISQPSAEEREVAAAAGANLDVVIYFAPGLDVRRGDLLTEVGTTDRWEVESRVRPSVRDSYVKTRCVLRQSLGGV